MSLIDPQLVAFLAIVKYKTVHSAAESLYMTQTAITQRIKALEQKLNVTLFIRSRRGMALTEEGLSLLHYCQAVKMLEGEFYSKIHGHHVDSIITVTLQAPSSIMHTRIIPSCVPVLKKHRNLRLNFNISDVENRHLALKSGDCDLAILLPEHVSPEMKTKKLKSDEYIIVGPSAWQGRSLKEIVKYERIIDYDPSDQMTFNYLKQYDLFELCHKDRHYVNSPESLVELIKNAVGYTVITKEFYQQYPYKKDLSILDQQKIFINEVRLCWHQRKQMPQYFSDIIDAIQ